MSDIRQDPVKEALAYCFRLLTRRDYPLNALRDRLVSRGYARETVDDAAARLIELRLVDDESYVRRYVEHVLTRKPAGRAKVIRDLRHRGVEDELARRIVDEELTSDLEDAMARNALRGRGVDPDVLRADPKVAARHYRFLKGRGFPDGVIRRVMRDAEDSR